MADPNRGAGFTLLELLVALVVLGFVMVGLSRGTELGLKAWDLQQRTVARIADLDATDRALRNLIGGLDPTPHKDGTPALAGSAASMTFRGLLPAAVTSSRIADMQLGLGPDNRLILRWRPYWHEEPFGPPPPETETELLRGVVRLELAYWGVNGTGPAGWLTAWSAPGPPTMVRVRIGFGPRDPRRWPDIVVALRRDPPQS
jgi:general secretion pathway protein J